jgi:hypothetical protein
MKVSKAALLALHHADGWFNATGMKQLPARRR